MYPHGVVNDFVLELLWAYFRSQVTMSSDISCVRHGTASEITTIDSHTAGEPTRIITGGVPTLPGLTILDKMRYFERHLDHLRRAILWEPRGHSDMVGAVVVPPCDDRALLGAFFLDAGGYLSMCGHGTIGLVTVALEEGLATCPSSVGIVDTPAGLVAFRVSLHAGRVEEVTIRNVPSWLFESNLSLSLDSGRQVLVDVAYGGNWFALVDVSQFGIEVLPEHLDFFVRTGMSILRQANKVLTVMHPIGGRTETIDLVEFYDDCSPNHAASSRNVVIFGNGQFDRSPCGTGTCAKMAMLHARGRLGLNETYVSESIMGSLFIGRLVGETSIGAVQAVVPEITGRAWITGRNTLIVDSNDPFASGFLTSSSPWSA
jgi:proline racemase